MAQQRGTAPAPYGSGGNQTGLVERLFPSMFGLWRAVSRRRQPPQPRWVPPPPLDSLDEGSADEPPQEPTLEQPRSQVTERTPPRQEPVQQSAEYLQESRAPSEPPRARNVQSHTAPAPDPDVPLLSRAVPRVPPGGLLPVDIETTETTEKACEELRTVQKRRADADAVRVDAQRVLDEAEVVQDDAEQAMVRAHSTFAKAAALNPEALKPMANAMRTLEEAIRTERHLQLLTRQDAEEESDRARQRATDAILNAFSGVHKAMSYVNRELEEAKRARSTAASLKESAQNDLKRAQEIMAKAETLVRYEARRILDEPRTPRTPTPRDAETPVQRRPRVSPPETRSVAERAASEPANLAPAETRDTPQAPPTPPARPRSQPPAPETPRPRQELPRTPARPSEPQQTPTAPQSAVPQDAEVPVRPQTPQPPAERVPPPAPPPAPVPEVRAEAGPTFEQPQEVPPQVPLEQFGADMEPAVARETGRPADMPGAEVVPPIRQGQPQVSSDQDLDSALDDFLRSAPPPEPTVQDAALDEALREFLSSTSRAEEPAAPSAEETAPGTRELDSVLDEFLKGGPAPPQEPTPPRNADPQPQERVGGLSLDDLDFLTRELGEFQPGQPTGQSEQDPVPAPEATQAAPPPMEQPAAQREEEFDYDLLAQLRDSLSTPSTVDEPEEAGRMGGPMQPSSPPPLQAQAPPAPPQTQMPPAPQVPPPQAQVPPAPPQTQMPPAPQVPPPQAQVPPAPPQTQMPPAPQVPPPQAQIPPAPPQVQLPPAPQVPPPQAQVPPAPQTQMPPAPQVPPPQAQAPPPAVAPISAMPLAESYSGVLHIELTPASDPATLSFFWDVVDAVAGVGKVVSQTPTAGGSEFVLDLGSDVLVLTQLKERMPGSEIVAVGPDKLHIMMAAQPL